jgi:hypothetical protein
MNWVNAAPKGEDILESPTALDTIIVVSPNPPKAALED